MTAYNFLLTFLTPDRRLPQRSGMAAPGKYICLTDSRSGRMYPSMEFASVPDLVPGTLVYDLFVT